MPDATDSSATFGSWDDVFDWDHCLCLGSAWLLAGSSEDERSQVTVVSIPELDSEVSSNVDLIVSIEDQVWVIEHTFVESFDGQTQDTIRVRDVFDSIVSDTRDSFPPGRFRIIVPVGSVDGMKASEQQQVQAILTERLPTSGVARGPRSRDRAHVPPGEV